MRSRWLVVVALLAALLLPLAPASAQAPTILTTGACPTAVSGFALNAGSFCFQIPASLLFVWTGSSWVSVVSGGGALADPTITGTVAGGASYTGITATNPTITGTVAGGASYTSPTVTGTVAGSPTASGAWTFNPGPLAVTGTTNLTGPLFAIPGTSATLDQVGGVVLANSSTNATTAAAATETDLFNFSLLANSLSATNQFLDLYFRVRNAATANGKQTRVYFGATLIGDSTSIAANNNWWMGRCTIWRTGAATQKVICTALNVANGGAWNQGAGGGANLSTPAETLSGAVTIRITGTDAVAAAGTNLEAVNLVWYPAGQ